MRTDPVIYQLFVCPLFDNFSVPHDVDPIRHPRLIQTVRDDKGAAARSHPRGRLIKRACTRGPCLRGRLVHNHHSGIEKQNASQRELLRGDWVEFLPDPRIQVGVAFPSHCAQCLTHVLVGGVLIAQAEIIAHGTGKDVYFLGDEREEVAPVGIGKCAYRCTIDSHLPAIRGTHPGRERRHGGFTRT